MKKKIAVIVVAIVLCVAAAVFAVPKISFYACEPTVYFDVEYCDKVDKDVCRRCRNREENV